ncbi:mitochondrial distribution/morphology family 35/apoptosis [Cantharellus anzutake]|uniref:mitochondrial distribution/morphology family 35/apoptosis n=1 Tax=Cantharellus anzutake TaxID=1750568 RepID=UPI001908A66F|nr:mitochondrial distribution/morphology family 35/apoptosis [Cantharellus anzutake]KAF8325847.1 mitochondrial distribution/morphology family 35/apoptosis [Cantharellus anzutake]
MASSLSPECTPLKKEYDSCFNSWFEGYLEPPSHGVGKSLTDAEREKWSREKAEEYDRKCGSIWRSYKKCVQEAVSGKGLDKLLEDAREENPLKDPPPPSGEERSS